MPREGRDSAESIRLFDDADLAWRQAGPSPRAVRAFGVRDATMQRLPGGAGFNWTDGVLVPEPVVDAVLARFSPGVQAAGAPR